SPPARPVETRRAPAGPTPPLADTGTAPPDRAVPANTPPRPDRGDAHPATLVSGADTVSTTTGARVYAELVDALAGQFDYPGVARQRGWQGMVRLGVHVAPDGTLRQIAILHSSGYRVLDHAALLSLQKVAWLPAVANWQITQGFDMVVPVEYRLVDG
ncbi:MAG: periplasmic protein TonB, partial [Gammaproteobacteria bacterium]